MCNALKNGHPAHTPEIVTLVQCKDCHRTTCFTHLLQSYTHAVEALLICGGDSISRNGRDGRTDKPVGRWHKWHSNAKGRFKSANAPGSEETNHLLFRLLRAAQAFTHYRPVDDSRTLLGWYDQPFIVISFKLFQSLGLTDIFG